MTHIDKLLTDLILKSGGVHNISEEELVAVAADNNLDFDYLAEALMDIIEACEAN